MDFVRGLIFEINVNKDSTTLRCVEGVLVRAFMSPHNQDS